MKSIGSMAVDLDRFSEELGKIQLRWQQLSQHVQVHPEPPTQLLMKCLEEMGLALEELHVAEEELLASNHEISEKNETLAVQAKRYQDLFEFAPDAYLETDLYGKILAANRHAVGLFGSSDKKLSGHPITSLVTPADRPSFRTKLNRMAILQRVQDWEVQCLRRPDQVFDAVLTVEIVPGRDGPEALRWLIRDVTDSKRAQAELQAVKLQNLELAESDRFRQQFISHIIHELRTPLNSIMGFAELLQKRQTPDANPQSVEFVKRIRRSGSSLQGMIHELLDFSRIKGKGLTLRPQSFDLCHLITQVLDDLAPLSEQKSLTLAANLPDTLEVFNDEGRVRQVLVNLVSNAIKFTDRGSVTVKLQTRSPDRFVLAVQDTGIGIDPADQAHIFEDFWQVQQDPQRRALGTGLGLAIVHAIVQSMGGTITLESTRNLGTTFFVELPRSIRVEPS